jgi:hypothetical protein
MTLGDLTSLRCYASALTTQFESIGRHCGAGGTGRTPDQVALGALRSSGMAARPRVMLCEVGYTLLDGGRWPRQPAPFVRWRTERSPADCGLDQLSHA